MTVKMLIVVALLSQCLVISYFFPRRRLGRLRLLLTTYPPATHPRLYPRPIEFYENAQRNYQIANGIVLLIGFGLVGTMAVVSWGEDWAEGLMAGYYMVQMLPLVLLDRSSYGFSELFRETQGRTRTAELRPRRLRDFASPALAWTALGTYAGFVALVLFVASLDFEWFSAGANITILTATNLLMLGVAIRSIRRRKVNPYQSSEDRERQLEFVVRTMVLTSIAVSLFACGAITMAAFELRHLQPVALSLYLQLLALMTLSPPENRNFEVYREAAAT